MPPSSPFSGRRRFLKTLGLSPLALALPSAGCSTSADAESAGSPTKIDTKGAPLRIALMADCQYADVDAKDPKLGRQYVHSPQKLADAVRQVSETKPHLAVHLGDLIDRDFASFGVVSPIFDTLGCPRFHIAGNHDYAGVADADKGKVRAVLRMPDSGWYEVRVEGWRLIFLESNEVGLMRFAAGSPEYVAAKAEMSRRRSAKPPVISAQEWNGGLGDTQRAWLADRLDAARAAGERAVIFCHQPVRADDMHSLWDSAETLALIAPYRGTLVAWINGHDHAGDYRVVDGIHHWNLKGMVETRENTFAVATFHPDRIDVRGYGREPSRVLRLPV